MPEVRKTKKRSACTRQKNPNKATASGNITACPTSSSPNRRRILPLAAGRSSKYLEVARGPSFGAKARIENVLRKSDRKTTPSTSPGHLLLNPHPSPSPNQPLRRTLSLPMSTKKSMKTITAPEQSLSKSPAKSGVNPYAKVRKSVSSLASSSAKKPSPVRNPYAKSPRVTKSPMSSKSKASAHNPHEKISHKKQKVADNGTASNPVDIEDSPLFDIDGDDESDDESDDEIDNEIDDEIDSDDEIEIVDASEVAVNVVQVVHKNATDEDDEVIVVGHVNHVELPHLRQHCTAFPFDEDTPDVHDVYAQSVVTVNVQSCPLCYCYVCDRPVKDCSEWHSVESGNFLVNHCCATEKLDLWTQRRKRNYKATGAAAKKKRKSPRRSSEANNIITIDDSDPEDIFTS
jgi:hypothetical protein